MNNSKQSQGRLPGMEHTGSQIPFTATQGDSSTNSHKLVLWNTGWGGRIHLSSLWELKRDKVDAKSVGIPAPDLMVN